MTSSFALMFRAPVYLTSDIHLGAIPEERARAFRGWLRHAGENARTIVINGDLFDFWFEYGSVIPRGFTRALGLLAEIADQGTCIVLLGGNHDWWGGSFLRDEVGVDFRQEASTLDLAGWRTLLAHGDGVGEGDLGYRLLRQVIRSRPARWAFRWLHPDLGAQVARAVSFTEGRPAESAPEENERAAALRRWAERRLAEEADLDLVVMGHTHVPDFRRTPPGSGGRTRPGYYVNTGDWVHHSTYLVLEEDGAPPRMKEWPVGEAEGAMGRKPRGAAPERTGR